MFQQNIYIIGAGGIVNDAHLPAYKLAGYNVQGIFDIDVSKATATATKFSIPQVFNSINEMIATAESNAVFDMVVSGNATMAVLRKLPGRATVLLQKPMGENLAPRQHARLLKQGKQALSRYTGP